MRAFVVGAYMNANFLAVGRLPAPGESLLASGHFQEHGGKGLNLAVGLHRLGVAVDLLMAVGEDAAGAAVRRRLAQEGLDTGLVLTLGPASGFGVGFIAADGGNCLAVNFGANALLSAAHLDAARERLAAADWVLAQFEVPEGIVLAAFQEARRRGIRTVLNPSPWRRIDPALLTLTDLLVVNANEGALLFDQPDLVTATAAVWRERLPALAAALGCCGRLLVVTLGAQGSMALTAADGVVSQPAWPIRQRDSTGAGDAFGAGLVAGPRSARHRGVACRQRLRGFDRRPRRHPGPSARRGRAGRLHGCW